MSEPDKPTLMPLLVVAPEAGAAGRGLYHLSESCNRLGSSQSMRASLENKWLLLSYPQPPLTPRIEITPQGGIKIQDLLQLQRPMNKICNLLVENKSKCVFIAGEEKKVLSFRKKKLELSGASCGQDSGGGGR